MALFFHYNMLTYLRFGCFFGDRVGGGALNSLQELFPDGRATTLFVSGGNALLFTLEFRGDARGF